MSTNVPLHDFRRHGRKCLIPLAHQGISAFGLPNSGVIDKILTHLGLQARAPPRAPARGHALQAA
jgi:hypothetical protein